MSHFNQTSKNPPWVRNNVQQQPLLAQQMTVQSVALSQPLTTAHLGQNQLSQVQITPAIQGQVQLPLTQAHLLLNQQLTPTFSQVQINQAQLTNIATTQHQATTQTYFTPSISLQQNVGIPQGTIQIQPSSLVIPTSVSTSIAPPGLAMPTTLATVQNTGANYLSRMTVAPPQLSQPTIKQRVFSGTVTKTHENFGFIDDDVFFQTSSVKGNNPQIGDRVLVEASYNTSMPFKWNATRVQVIAPPQHQTQKMHPALNANLNEVVKPPNREWSIRCRSAANDYRESERLAPKVRDCRTRERRSRSNSLSPSRKRSRSPHTSPRRRSRNVPRYSVQIPRVSLDCRESNLVELRRRFSHMYVPSDFLSSIYWWVTSFPAQRPLPLEKPVAFHIFAKEVPPPEENTTVYEPADADYSYSAKVMLLSLPPLEEFYSKCCPDGDKEEFVHPARLIRFLVGIRGKNETMAIGGPWSPSLDGSHPQSDPQVLIRTAIRTCKALTGIDLSSCTQWYRVAEIRYHRVSSLKNRIESVLLFVPDIWSCVPTATQWEGIVQSYIQPAGEAAAEGDAKMDEDVGEEREATEPTHHSKLDAKNLNINELRSELNVRNLSSKGLRTQLIPRLTIALKAEAEEERQKQENQSGIEDEETSQQSLEESDESRRLDFAAIRQILVHPSRTAKGGKFNCALTSLSVLLDYRPEDTKEHTFEVSLFSELFNEMLMRDFGMLVYRSVASDAKRKDGKRDTKEEDDAAAAAADRKKKKLDKKKELNHPLLLAFSYFDLSHCNYIASKDLEDLFLTLGMQLSRAQVRKLLHKVITTDDSLRYKRLVERSSKEDDVDHVDSLHPAAAAAAAVAVGVTSENSDELGNGVDEKQSNLVLVNGCYVDVEQLLSRLHQSEESRRETENQFKISQMQLVECRKSAGVANESIDTLCQQLATEKQLYESTLHQLNQLQECNKQYIDGVNRIQSIASGLQSCSTSSQVVVVKEETANVKINAGIDDADADADEAN